MQVQVNRVSEALIEASTSEAETTIEVAGIPINHYEENCLVYQNNREFSRNRLKCGDLFFLHRMLVEKSWVDILDGEFDIEYAVKLCKFVENEVKSDLPAYGLCPPKDQIFHSFNIATFSSVKVVILGQKEPYAVKNRAMELAY
ncbi:uncharacterized protein LOC127137108 [Lathyrus oleraceus]|uniref:uncharacterized protein LOC127137108 n=1 Tax=Pisum sativum TaxID=3888 RepID=UPI0021D2FBCF|nr:uncharacterized protein LOC127137108 [Pisum sativum]